MILDELKEYLKITWDDEDEVLQRLIRRARDHLTSLCGGYVNFDHEGLAKQLLFDEIRYIRENAFEFFQERFKSDLLKLTLDSAIGEKMHDCKQEEHTKYHCSK